MRLSMRFLSLSRPLTLIACVVIYMIDPQVTLPGLAMYALSAAFFLASSALINGWLKADYLVRFWTTWTELALIAYLNWHSLYYYHNNAISAAYMVAIVSIPLTLNRKDWKPAFIVLIATWLGTTLFGVRNESWNDIITMMAIYSGAMLFFCSTGLLTRSLQDEQARSRRLLREVTESQAALERAHIQLQESAARQQQMAVLEERQRLAREIHDSVAHGLTALVVQTQAARKLLAKDPDRALDTVTRCEEMAREALQDTRRAVRALHPSGLEQQSDVDALQRLARDYGIATDMLVVVRADDAARTLPPNPARLEQLYRIFQEALTNAHRHGHAKTVAADLTVARDLLTMRISNDGERPTNLDPGVGLKSMAERARSIGAEITFQSGNPGLLIQVTVPLKQEVAE